MQVARFPFGAFDPDQATTWWITGSYGDNVELVAEALVSLVKSKVEPGRYKNRVTVRQVLQYGVFYGPYNATFVAPPPWCRKQLPMNSGFAWLLLSVWGRAVLVMIVRIRFKTVLTRGITLLGLLNNLAK